MIHYRGLERVEEDGKKEVERMPFPPKKVMDTRLGRIFPSLNKCYLTLLREGELEAMRKAGRLAPNPEEDNFGYYKMRRFYPGRFIQEDDLRWQEVCQANE